MTEYQKKMLGDQLFQIEHHNTEIMKFLYEYVEPEQRIDDIEDTGLKTICKAIVKWSAEMNEYWLDDYRRVIHNYIWACIIRAAINKFNKNCYTVDDEELAIVNGNF